MTLRLEPVTADQAPTSPPAVRTQQFGRVAATLDGDAHLHAWEPNGDDDRLDIDLTPALALLLDIGLDAPPARRPHWTDGPDSVTIIVSLDVGAAGAITIDGRQISERTAVNLAANGFVGLLYALPERPDDSPGAETATNTGDDDSPDDAAPGHDGRAT